MSLNVIGAARDLRTDTLVVYAQVPIPDYISLVGDEFEDFSIQRRREVHRAYHRLKEDIRAGALLPSITLALKPERVAAILPLVTMYQRDASHASALADALSVGGQVDILDGLQRTYIIKDLQKEGHVFVDGQTILIEFWLEAGLNNLIYRIIVLNAGQKPMSMRHQIELLFMSLKTSVENTIPHLELYTERERTRRHRSRKFPLNVIVSAYQAYITGSPELHKENIIANQLMEETALDSSEEEISKQFTMFKEFLTVYADLDDEVTRVYRSQRTESDDEHRAVDYLEIQGPLDQNWLATENVALAFFAALAQFGTSQNRISRIRESLQVLLSILKRTNQGGDPLGLTTFEKLRAGNNPRRTNVGLATRRLLTNGFKEYFRESGEMQLMECWQLGAE